jgi:hypothetical protein
MSDINQNTYQDYKRACLLGTDTGFFQAYFDALPNNRTNEETFLAVNDEALQHFGEEKYISYDAFRAHLGRYLKRKHNSK